MCFGMRINIRQRCVSQLFLPHTRPCQLITGHQDEPRVCVSGRIATTATVRIAFNPVKIEIEIRNASSPLLLTHSTVLTARDEYATALR